MLHAAIVEKNYSNAHYVQRHLSQINNWLNLAIVQKHHSNAPCSHSGEKPFQFSICQKAFTQSGNLTVHKRSHSTGKPFQWCDCLNAFKSIKEITVYKHSHSGQKPFQWSLCTEAFKSHEKLNVHWILKTSVWPHFSNIGYGGRRRSHGEWPYKFSRSSLTNGWVMKVGTNKDTD